MSESGCPVHSLYKSLKRNSSAKGKLDITGQIEAWFDLLQLELPEENTDWKARRLEVLSEFSKTGTYWQSKQELDWGARIAWRNSIRCVGRYFWRELTVIDARKCTTSDEIFEACKDHLRFATNGGNIRPTVTVFAPDTGAAPGPRILNPQLIRYAGFPLENERDVEGDPLMLNFTQRVMKMGWQPGKRGRFTVLPLLIQTTDQKLSLHELPAHLVKEVPLSHPDLPGFAELNLKWHAVPVVSDMFLEIGGIRYGAAPFNGWYMETEIGSRNLGDSCRYNILPEVAAKMGLSTENNLNLWRDRALVEVNQAVLSSFKSAGVKIIDHHTVSHLHVKFEEEEKAAARPVTGLWSWLIPPLSGSASPLWNRQYDKTQYLPAFVRHSEAV